MRYRSTRDDAARATVSFSEAIQRGLAPDGGLYIPTELPRLAISAFDGADTVPDIADVLLAPFLTGDPLADMLPAITREAFSFPAPLVPIIHEPSLAVLELYHGPTAAFKDFGARFLAAALTRARASDTRPLEILVATSGDTGGAVAAAFHRRAGVHVSVLYPAGRVSPTQEQQLTCWGDNVTAYRVAGSFDDCQAMVKAAFADAQVRNQLALSSANSINLGRLLPQMVYYAAMSLDVWRRTNIAPDVIVPSGNLGNAVACVWARAVGLPIGRVTLAHNANAAVAEWAATGGWHPRASVPTHATAMDVGAPSNMERLRVQYPTAAALHADGLSVTTISDAQIAASIRRDVITRGRIWDPHTAVAAATYDMQLATGPGASGQTVLVATAHPAKFRETVEPLVSQTIEVPASLAALLGRPTHSTELPTDVSALTARLTSH
jgi:threonine synthase